MRPSVKLHFDSLGGDVDVCRHVDQVGEDFPCLAIFVSTHPTVLLTNELQTSTAKLVTRYAQRMLIENALSDAVRFFHMDALSSAVGLKADFDMALLVIASGLYRILGRRMRGYKDSQARKIFSDLIDMPANVNITSNEIEVEFHRRAHLPIIMASGMLEKPIKVPWWNGKPLRLTTYST